MTQPNTYHTKVSQNMQTYIPKDIQSKLNLGPNQTLSWLVLNDTIYIQKANSPKEIINSSLGIANSLYKKHGGGQKWLAKERQSWK